MYGFLFFYHAEMNAIVGMATFIALARVTTVITILFCKIKAAHALAQATHIGLIQRPPRHRAPRHHTSRGSAELSYKPVASIPYFIIIVK